MEPKKLNPEQGVEQFESYQQQRELDNRKEQLDARPELTDAERLERLWLDVGTYCQTVLFTIPEAGPTIEQIKADIPGLLIIAQAGTSYRVSMPANDESLGKFNQLYGNLPDPAAEDMSALLQEV